MISHNLPVAVYCVQMRYLLRNGIWVVLGLLLLLLIWNHQLILYGVSQGKGQLKVVWNSRDLQEVFDDPAVPDSVKYKLRLIQEVKAFTVDQLGFKQTKNYQAYYDQEGKPSLWVVTGAKPLALEPKQWYFPFLGAVPYKGFFDYEKALKEEQKLEGDWDTNLRVVGGWSTLGWFKDPVLSNMLLEPEGELVNTIVHELTHGNLFVKDSVEFNENLASFFGDQGARLFLQQKFGGNSPEMKKYEQKQSDQRKFTSHVLRGATLLDELYQAPDKDISDSLRLESKRNLIREIIATADTLGLYEKDRYLQYLQKSKVNNAFFMSFLRYRADLSIFEQELNTKFKGNLRAYFQYFREQYPSL